MAKMAEFCKGCGRMEGCIKTQECALVAEYYEKRDWIRFFYDDSLITEEEMQRRIKELDTQYKSLLSIPIECDLIAEYYEKRDWIRFLYEDVLMTKEEMERRISELDAQHSSLLSMPTVNQRD